MNKKSFFEFSARNIRGEDVLLGAYKGRVLLVVNVASRCGFTPQYEGLEQLQKKFESKGFSVLGFPCNQFGAQEPGTEQEIQSFCSTQYDVTFPMFSKIDVNGPKTHPVYEFLKSQQPGMFGTQSIKWNFTKFLIDRSGHVIHRYGPHVSPARIEADIEKELMKI